MILCNELMQERLKKEQEEKEHKKKEKAEAHLYTIIKVLSFGSWFLKDSIEYLFVLHSTNHICYYW